MSETTATPAHRVGTESRSGDSHLINADGVLVNLDAEARDAAAKAEKKPTKPAKASPDSGPAAD